MMQMFSGLKWVGNILRRQVQMNASYRQVLMILQDTSKLAQSEEVQATIKAIRAVQTVCQNHPPKFEKKITSVEYTVYVKDVSDVFGNTTSIQVGPISHVTTRRSTMSSDGGYVTSSYEIKPELTERLLKNVRYFKQKVRSHNFFTVPEKTQEINNIITVKLATANWDSANIVENYFHGTSGMELTTETKNSIIYGTDLSTVLEHLKQQFNDSSTVSANVSWDGVSGKGNLKVTKMYAKEANL